MNFTSSPSQIQHMFDRIAPVYDLLNDWLSLGLHRVWKQMTVNWSNPDPAGIAIDLCCGTGDLTFLLAKKIKKGKVIGVDFSPRLLAVAREKARRRGYDKIEWLEADVLKLPFPDNSIDCITMGYGLRNVVDIPAGMREIWRVLKPGKKAAILDFHRPDNGWLAAAQQWYLENIVVTAASFFGNQQDYAYIHPSIKRFPNGKQQIAIAKQIGFSQQTHYPLMGGMMGVLVLTK
ncbi:MAG: bifunctional demethylmenaquinone methyltransferase/2-methoxy-6-polyprenyl-1,4-benzoquinol methylase UbiE [Geminocystis sp.]|nr:bifunctional demethylmenaquinone methyltransferase/2-methoxy-6-polyprenyl-1,4-benzoquinol methylase UbiE [Geminocystis sp.]HIK36641.1 bifunctional demethylmenaquinone methyltransferase/2-methoxy-6-polyprenyl-1,4-benzoquinol methylase UbiE [Geminocystis sp. M7585_C2015_104]MCS7147904.1 bifunctional demethylmenaquinone methyltransferase/2-methoxy-6-polyprenyl-1,4-benzoquinol methylase UbiE [Geminocystis sp.]MCX8078730.1 bifunctional demethylmenaquinone methyltransferase/2-methoxy-6-polyprenyl-1